jgi:hypothetical protein
MTKPSSRGRRWLQERAPNSTAQGRRLRSLYRTFVAPLNTDDPTHQAAAMAAAELVVASEDARARLLGGDPAAEAAVVRLENACRRGKLDLVTLTPKPLSWWEQRQLEEQEEEADGQAEEEADGQAS